MEVAGRWAPWLPSPQRSLWLLPLAGLLRWHFTRLYTGQSFGVILCSRAPRRVPRGAPGSGHSCQLGRPQWPAMRPAPAEVASNNDTTPLNRAHHVWRRPVEGSMSESNMCCSWLVEREGAVASASSIAANHSSPDGVCQPALLNTCGSTAAGRYCSTDAQTRTGERGWLLKLWACVEQASIGDLPRCNKTSGSNSTEEEPGPCWVPTCFSCFA